MKVIPVADLMKGQMVHAVRGQRKEYAPVRGVLGTGERPLSICESLENDLGLIDLYVADLDAIEGTGDNRRLIAELARSTDLDFVLDAGTGDLAAARECLDLGIDRVVIGTETIEDLEEAAKIARQLRRSSIASLDMRGPAVLSKNPSLSAAGPVDAAILLDELGFRELILLDLSRVGAMGGPDTGLVSAVVDRVSADVLVGGGVRNADDLAALDDLGIAGCLVGSALHSGAIGSDELGSVGAASPENIITELARRRSGDAVYGAGRVLNAMCSSPPDLALEASSPYILSNAGDAYLFPSLGHLEEDVLRFVGRLVGDPDAPGFLVSGGSEANLMALHAARKAAGDGRCELVAARSAHFSIRKAADLLGMQLVTIPLDVDFRLDLSALKASIGPDTAAVVATAGTAELGCIDDVEGIAELCREEGVHLHVDAAFGGFVIPFLRELGVSTTRFGFDVPGVSSVTIDPHKMGLAPVPCGCVLFANEGLAESLRVATPYVDGGASSTVLGTRPGWSMAGAWATIRLHGRSGYREIVRQCISKTSRIAKGVHRMEGARLVVEPSMNVMGIECLEPDAVLGRLRELGWRVTLAESPRCLRVVVMPHIADEDVDMFLGDLRTALD
ncbi:MAG: tyrosine decarboxylase MfnA [Candidatus Undinarchaeales archaeon]|nr:tyrosine decarboxylase MfnA [Candidatus Undinarchaeales archaeon]